jgi:5-guanidino-2-oxopentanoate decarboxylase
MTELNTGEALVGLLEEYGVDTVFGIPGVHNVEMYRALPRSKIRHVLPRHEQGAGFMADGYARATGKPGVCFTITGPGLLNILTPMGQAWSDSSNILVVSSALDIGDSAQGRGRLHEMIGQHDAAKSVTSLAMRAYTPLDVQDGLARAFSHFASARPRPAYLEIPLDLFSQSCGPGWKAKTVGSWQRERFCCGCTTSQRCQATIHYSGRWRLRSWCIGSFDCGKNRCCHHHNSGGKRFGACRPSPVLGLLPCIT